jgi:hypothetical protein
MIVLIGIAGLAAILKLTTSGQGGGAPQTPVPPSPSAEAIALSKMRIHGKWSRGGSAHILNMDFSIANDGDRDVKDPEIHCPIRGLSGTLISHNDGTIYEVVPAHDSILVGHFNLGFVDPQSVEPVCEIRSIAFP